MAHGNGHSQGRNRKKFQANKAPFDLQIPSSLRDPHEATLHIDQLAHLRNLDTARDVALGFLHDPEQFASIWSSDRLHPETRRFMRKLVQIQTINAVYNKFYRLPDGTKVALDKLRMFDAASNTRQYVNDFNYNTRLQAASYEDRAQIFVVDGDCLDVALCFKDKDPQCRPVVLNMASARNPGGGWRNGRYLFRRMFRHVEVYATIV